MRTTEVRTLVAVGLVCGVAAGLLVRAFYVGLPALPTGPVITVGVVALIELFVAWATRNRLRGRPGTKPIVPLAVARYAALARASSPVGIGTGGAWAGILVFLLTQRGGLAAVSRDRGIAIAGVVVGIALAAVALWLEWVCRARPPRDDRPTP